VGIGGGGVILATGDLSSFAGRMASAGSLENEGLLKKTHFRRLAAVVGFGLVLGGATLVFQLQLNLGWTFLLGLLATLSLSRLVSLLKSDHPQY